MPCWLRSCNEAYEFLSKYCCLDLILMTVILELKMILLKYLEKTRELLVVFLLTFLQIIFSTMLSLEIFHHAIRLLLATALIIGSKNKCYT